MKTCLPIYTLHDTRLTHLQSTHIKLLHLHLFKIRSFLIYTLVIMKLLYLHSFQIQNFIISILLKRSSFIYAVLRYESSHLHSKTQIFYTLQKLNSFSPSNTWNFNIYTLQNKHKKVNHLHFQNDKQSFTHTIPPHSPHLHPLVTTPSSLTPTATHLKKEVEEEEECGDDDEGSDGEGHAPLEVCLVDGLHQRLGHLLPLSPRQLRGGGIGRGWLIYGSLKRVVKESICP